MWHTSNYFLKAHFYYNTVKQKLQTKIYAEDL